MSARIESKPEFINENDELKMLIDRDGDLMVEFKDYDGSDDRLCLCRKDDLLLLFHFLADILGYDVEE